MIARIWHGVSAAAKADEYLDYLNETGVPDYRGTERNRGVYVVRRVEEEDKAHFLRLSLWDSIEDVERFAGPEPERAKYYPADEEFLLNFEPTVEHYEVVVAPRSDA
ncbi:MAG: Antibiotic biosynthesis monooxygenase [Rubrobacteraceae bacterium]|jgi:heme-degrading monooxygenase HmoA|nr:Antibiotic biosynthesis monooxygenase [Rubrobacteraceae bacterium]